MNNIKNQIVLVFLISLSGIMLGSDYALFERPGTPKQVFNEPINYDQIIEDVLKSEKNRQAGLALLESEKKYQQECFDSRLKSYKAEVAERFLENLVCDSCVIDDVLKSIFHESKLSKVDADFFKFYVIPSVTVIRNLYKTHTGWLTFNYKIFKEELEKIVEDFYLKYKNNIANLSNKEIEEVRLKVIKNMQEDEDKKEKEELEKIYKELDRLDELSYKKDFVLHPNHYVYSLDNHNAIRVKKKKIT